MPGCLKRRFYRTCLQKRRCHSKQGKMNCGHSQSQRSNHWEQLASILLSPGGHIPENVGQSPGTALGILRPTGPMVQQPSEDGENQRPPPSCVKRLLWQQQDCQKSARVWAIHRFKSSLCLLSCEGLETCAETS